MHTDRLTSAKISKYIYMSGPVYIFCSNLILDSQSYVAAEGAEHTFVTIVDRKSLSLFFWLGLPHAEFVPNALLECVRLENVEVKYICTIANNMWPDRDRDFLNELDLKSGSRFEEQRQSQNRSVVSNPCS
jgi:hypothetical protein